jgi:flavin reductase (DIM6/NTAB) family NADH-FMN oxidoreductase RutF
MSEKQKTVSFINESHNTVFVMTALSHGHHYAMVATWLAPASLRTDEVRFTFALSRHNRSADAILETKRFIIHKLPETEYLTAFSMGHEHSNEVDKFRQTPFTTGAEGIRILAGASAFGLAHVLGELPTEDRVILYCAVREFVVKDPESRELTQEQLFHRLSQEQRDILTARYLADGRRDTPMSSGHHSGC